jgi:hypothetical protein
MEPTPIERNVEVLVEPDGAVKFIYDDDLIEVLGELGVARIARASHVEPSEDSPGEWMVDMSLTTGEATQLGPFSTRREAIAAEVNFLREYLQLG